MRLSHLTLLILSFLLLSGCATKEDLNFLRYDLDGLNTRFSKMEKETKEGVEQSSKGIQTDMESIRKGEADLQANIEAMKVDLQVLTGKLDDTAIMAKKPADDVVLLRDDMERRFTMIQVRMAKLEKDLEELKKGGETERTPDTVYQKGLDAFRAGDIAKARELLTKFLDIAPNHQLAANAHYWLGETFYSDKKYDQAVLEFQEVIKNFPGKEKVPAAMLKQGMAFKEIGDRKSAKYVLKKLLDDYPASDEAKNAREKLKGLQ